MMRNNFLHHRSTVYSQQLCLGLDIAKSEVNIFAYPFAEGLPEHLMQQVLSMGRRDLLARLEIHNHLKKAPSQETYHA